MLTIFVLLMLLVSFFRAFFGDPKNLTREVFFVFAIMIGIPLSVVYGPKVAETVFGNQLGDFQPIAGFLIVLGLIFLFAYVLSAGMGQWVSNKENTAGKFILGIFSVIEGMLVVGSILYATSIFSQKMDEVVKNNKMARIPVGFARWVYLDFVNVDEAVQSKQKFAVPPRVRTSRGRIIIYYPDSAIIKFPIPDSLGGGGMSITLINPDITYKNIFIPSPANPKLTQPGTNKK